MESITNLDSDRKNSLNFLLKSDLNYFGQGFNTIVIEYQQYLTNEINQEMYLTNRVLPKYLNISYQSQNFGTGNYSANFYKPNTQSMLINVIISSGIILILILFAVFSSIGSIVYSEVVGFIPCRFCWYQRYLMYPIAIALIISLFKRPFFRVGYISIIGVAVSAYHIFLQNGGGGRICLWNTTFIKR